MNVEKEFIKYLSTIVDVPVSADIPEDRPDQFITVSRSSGGLISYGIFDSPVIMVEIYNRTSAAEAADLAGRISREIYKMAELPNISSIQVNSLVRNDDIREKYRRYNLYVDVFANVAQ